MVVAAVAQEPLLLVGPPGTAKSDLVLKFKDALGLADEDYFEYMLTRFTEPSEIIGPIDISQLREGRYIRREQGKLPTARLGFLDEIFKSNSAILNILLTIINERKFYQDGAPQPVRLRVLFAATNEVPEQAELAALKDRFCLKAESRSVQEHHFTELIDCGLQSEVYKTLNQKPWMEGHCTLDDVLKANRYLMYTFARRHRAGRGEEQNDRQVFFPAEAFDEFQRLVKVLVREHKVFISDRKLVKLYKLFRVRAWLFTGGSGQPRRPAPAGLPRRDASGDRIAARQGAAAAGAGVTTRRKKSCLAFKYLALRRKHRLHPPIIVRRPAVCRERAAGPPSWCRRRNRRGCREIPAQPAHPAQTLPAAV